jgi:hypothetical protein
LGGAMLGNFLHRSWESLSVCEKHERAISVSYEGPYQYSQPIRLVSTTNKVLMRTRTVLTLWCCTRRFRRRGQMSQNGTARATGGTTNLGGSSKRPLPSCTASKVSRPSPHTQWPPVPTVQPNSRITVNVRLYARTFLTRT